jgi:hypothetical protein
MSNGELYTTWGVSLAIAAVVVVIAVVLLAAIWRAAQDILADAREALDAAERIAADTEVIWELEASNRVAGEILDAACSGASRARRERSSTEPPRFGRPASGSPTTPSISRCSPRPTGC